MSELKPFKHNGIDIPQSIIITAGEIVDSISYPQFGSFSAKIAYIRLCHDLRLKSNEDLI